MAGFCTQCGATLTGHERFCPTCGTATNAEQYAPPAPQQPTPPAPTSPPPPAPSAPWSAPGAYAPPGYAPPVPPPPSGTGVPYAPPAWYPPTAATANPPTSRALATWLQVLLWIASGVYVLAAIVVLVVRAAAQAFYDAPAGSDFDEAQRWIDREDLGTGVQALSWFIGIAVFVLLVIWAFQLTRAVNRHQPYGRRWSPGWAVGAWFIPLANCVLCPMILWEDEKIATAGTTEVRDRWKSVSPRPWVIIWFVLWAIAAVLLTISSDALTRTDETDLPSRSGVMNGYVVLVVAVLVGAAASAVAALTVRHLTRLDHGDGTARPGWEPAPAPVATSDWASPR
jgi:hypothetical protein